MANSGFEANWQPAAPVRASLRGLRGRRSPSVLERRRAWQEAHPDKPVTLPWDSASGHWEVDLPDGKHEYLNGELMMDDLEHRYPVP
jgi:hypothetical protein